jgi:nitrite reductase/ring-hydroxylating ferredoxin subunit
MRRYVDALLRGRRPPRFQADEHEAAEMRAAIALRAARPGAEMPREEFLTDLRRRLADQAAQGPAGPGTQGPAGPDVQNPTGPGTQNPAGPDAQNPAGPDAQNPAGSAAQKPTDPGASGGARPAGPDDDRAARPEGDRAAGPVVPLAGRRVVSRRRLVATTGIAAGAAAVVGAGADRLLGPRDTGAGSDGAVDASRTLEPNVGEWRTVVAGADLPHGASTRFDLGTVVGFVTRSDAGLEAVSGMCTHLGCRLMLNAEVKRLDCPCHITTFRLDGEVDRHQLPVAPPPLPRLKVREADGFVQVFAPLET